MCVVHAIPERPIVPTVEKRDDWVASTGVDRAAAGLLSIRVQRPPAYRTVLLTLSARSEIDIYRGWG